MKPFIPSGTDLAGMMDRAMARFDQQREVMMRDEFEGVCLGCYRDGEPTRLKILAADGGPCCSVRCAERYDDRQERLDRTIRHNACAAWAPEGE